MSVPEAEKRKIPPPPVSTIGLFEDCAELPRKEQFVRVQREERAYIPPPRSKVELLVNVHLVRVIELPKLAIPPPAVSASLFSKEHSIKWQFEPLRFVRPPPSVVAVLLMK